ncbi:serine protease [Terricaulis sp.]|uniref:serine protease n=1 Tax=Terricaulis sp. TaxID=2768686 RepID=UPI003783AB83
MIAKAIRFLALALVVLLAVPASAQDASPTVDEAASGIVRVVVILETPQSRMVYGAGSGFVVAPNLVVTSAHVVAAVPNHPEYSVAVVPPTGDGPVAARIVRYSPLTQLALLEFRGPQTPALAISTVEPRPGDTAVALGYPDVDYQGASAADLMRPTAASRTSGQIASLRDRAPTGEEIATINHTAVISSGSSGGPLVDECGRVIGVNSWHVSGADTGETRGVATRVPDLLDFLEEANVRPRTLDDRCLTVAERVQADRQSMVEALQQQNEELTAKLEMADRLTRISVVILIGGTLALFVAVCVLGAVLLSRRHHPRETHETEPQPFDERPRRSALGVAAVVGGAAVAAILIVAAGIALLRTRATQELLNGEQDVLSGAMSCTFDPAVSRGTAQEEDVSFTVSGALCVNGRTLYAQARDGRRYQRALLSGEAHALDVLTIDPQSHEFTRERYRLSDEAFQSARAAVEGTSAEGCTSPDAHDAAIRRNETLMRFAEGRPQQRLLWRCELTEPTP